MNSGKYVFSQVLSTINRYELDCCVKRYNGDYRMRELNCWNQFVQLFFGQLASLNSLRDICLCLGAHRSKLYHLGISQPSREPMKTATGESSPTSATT